MLEQTLCELSLFQAIFWVFIARMVWQIGSEIVIHIFNRNQNEEDSQIS